MSKLRVYLAGPIRGCNDEQRTHWRSEVKQALRRDFDFEDPAEWPGDYVLSREISKLEACDVVLANMWKESVGTTLGVIRACHQGKPVVLIDPNHIHSAILNGLVAPEKPVYTIDEACRRLQELAGEFTRSFVVRKRDGRDEPFATKKLAESVSLAAAAAGVTDLALEEQISGPVISALRRRGSLHGMVETGEIREALFDRLGWMSADPAQAMEVRRRSQAILDVWRKHEASKDVERAMLEAQKLVTALRAEREALLKELEARDARIRELERNPPPVVEPPPADLTEALRRVQIDFAGPLLVHGRAFESAEASPYRDVSQAWEALQLLGRYATERQLAELLGERFAGAKQWFGDHRDEVSGMEYVSRESETVRGMYREERTVVHEGTPLFAEQHLCLGDSFDPQYCLRIHFAPFEDKVVVAWCGRHLRNTRSG